MGIIVSSFIGCGREYLKNAYGDKVKIFDAVESIPLEDVDGQSNEDLMEKYVNTVMSVVDENDIVFIDSSNRVRKAFNEKNIDYDVFYPADSRRGEFVENQVRKRTKPNNIRDLDKNFEKWIKFIGNDPIIMQYINSVKNDNNAKPANNE